MKEPRSRTVQLFLMGGIALFVVSGASAFDLGDIQIHGFVSQGYIRSTEYDVLTTKSTDGSLAFNEVGLNFTSEPVENLRIGIQLFARDLGEMGNHEVEIDWAVGDYRWRDYLGFRIGKVKMPFGLYNEVRDADMARPTILLPQGIYPEVIRDLINAYMGGEFYGTVEMGGGGDLDYRLYGGTMDLDDSYVVERFMRNGAVAGLRGLPFPLENPSYALSNIEASMDHICGLMAEWRPPVDGLRLRGTWHTSASEFANNTTYSGWMGEIPVSITLHTDTIHETDENWVLSAEYTRGNLLLAGEYWESTISVQNTISGLPFPVPPMPASETTNLAYYGLVGYRFTPWFQLSSYYSEYFEDKDDKDGDGLVARGLPAHGAWSKDLTLAARFDINRHWLFKVEAHRVDGTALVDALANPVIEEQDWNMYLARFTFYF